jgi:hypothetical protein
MQTFLPFPDFSMSMACLDDARLGKQRAEALAIYDTLHDHKDLWSSNPAVKMWRGHLGALAWYYNLSLTFFMKRGFTNNKLDFLVIIKPVIFPSWLGNFEFHRSHQSNLLRKDEKHYRPWFGTTVPKNLDYIWPVK